MRFPFPGEDYQWQKISRVAIVCWLVFYVLFLIHTYNAHGGGLWIDNANLVTHESGHMLFGYLGMRIGIWGGTIMQLLVPLLLAISFAWRGQGAGAIFCTFFFFENFLGIALYMADARDKALPLVSIGAASGDEIIHDWNWIFNDMGMLDRCYQVASAVRFLGWMGMIATVCLLAWVGWRQQGEAKGLSRGLTRINAD
jgi:hypothetical protein